MLRAVIVAGPVLAGSATARVVAGWVGGWPNRWVQFAVLLTIAIIASLSVSRLTNQLMPLAMLLRMTMIFPDSAPSRMKVARRTTSVADIRSRLVSPRLAEQDAAATMLALVTALGRYDRRTRGHSERVRLFCDLLSEQLGLPAADAGRLRWAALIHDIGKLQIPIAVLNKPGKLNAHEWDLIREHPDAGAVLAAPLKDWLGPWFAGIAEHHEKYDGSGYPRGLTGTGITPAGRAIAVVDAFETMTASRSYKSARSTLSARAELTRCAGAHFDPLMVRAFLAISLPRLLWSVGPLAFVVNAPFLSWVGPGTARLGDVTASASAANLAGMTAVAMAVGVTPSSVAAAVPTTTAAHAPAAHHNGTAASRRARHDGAETAQSGTSGRAAATTPTAPPNGPTAKAEQKPHKKPAHKPATKTKKAKKAKEAKGTKLPSVKKTKKAKATGARGKTPQ